MRSSSTSGFAQNINIGFTVSKTGALNVDSLEQYRGFELWRDQVNAAGGIKAGGKNYKVQFVGSYDDESNVKRVQQLYSRMILEDNADFLFSPYSSSLTATAAIVTEQYGKIMLTSGCCRGQDLHAGQSLSVPDVRPRHGIPQRRAGHAQGQGPEGDGGVRV